MFKKIVKLFIFLALFVITGLAVIKWWINHEPAALSPIPMATENPDLTIRISPDFTPKPLPPTLEIQHPYLAETDQSLMHAGSWESDVHPAAGVMTKAAKVRSRRAGGSAARQCATFTFTQKGFPLMLCGGLTSFQLQLLDPESLDRLARYNLPMRPSTFEAMVKKDPEIIFTDTSGGAYFFLDNQDRAVLADSKQFIRRIGPVQDKKGKWSFKVFDSWDMNAYVPNDCYHYNNLRPTGECDALTTVMPDHNGKIWWVTRNGRFGTLDMETGEVAVDKFDNEEVQNSFALDKAGAYIATDHAMYHFRLEGSVPRQVWRLPYDRGTRRKVGSINQGSGTSPTLLGENYVTFADNADDRIAIIVAYRGDVPEGKSRQICRVPVFKSGASATDNSMIGYERSIILENNHGYTNSHIQKDYNNVTGGVVRVDVREDESGCDIIWESELKVPSVVPKLSLGNGLAYFYSFEILENGLRLWSLVGLDFETGAEMVRIPTGTGVGYNNNWASIAIAKSGDTYIGTRHGIIQIREP